METYREPYDPQRCSCSLTLRMWEKTSLDFDSCRGWVFKEDGLPEEAEERLCMCGIWTRIEIVFRAAAERGHLMR